ncbi:hypothetical protein PR048_029454 [Dryococelus australis]|uniref:Uncharacterized protein n=1 Tax=Dryococelus australis TaxID=614101 RepID=A0ABQ9GFU6_9NEOP|nr:hypothetical protein PR048_029454 [Dryococelus australis]
MPHNICVYRYHGNATYLIEVISKCDASFPKTHEELLKAVYCDTSSEKCMVNDCKKCVYELKSFHSQVTIFTCCLWHEKGVKSYIVVSNDLKHSKYSVWVFLKSIFNAIR